MNLANPYEVIDFLFEELPYVFWKDLNGAYRGGNQNQIKALGLKSADEFLGKTVFDLLEDQESAKLIDQNDKVVMNGGKSVVMEETINIDGVGKITFLSQKAPITKNGVLYGLIGFAVDITGYHEERQQLIREQLGEQFKFRRLLGTLVNSIQSHNISYVDRACGLNSKDDLSEQLVVIQLSVRQEEILFLLLLGKSITTIADIICKLTSVKMSHETVNLIIRSQLFKIFNVTSVEDLIARAMLLNIITEIPTSLMESIK